MLGHLAARTAAVTAGTALVVSLAGCAATVSKEEYNADLAKLREEIQTGDRDLARWLDSTNRVVAEHGRRLDALERELQAMRREYQVSIEKMKGMLKFNVPVHFEFDRSELREVDRPVLDRFATVWKEYYPEALVTVEGFADAAGSNAYNLRLGQRRAAAVRNYLVGTGGVAAGAIRAVSYGEITNRQVLPGAKGPGETGVENRRVTLVIDHASIAAGQVAMP
jgi:peptidoglycan-associated lipoprotein